MPTTHGERLRVIYRESWDLAVIEMAIDGYRFLDKLEKAAGEIDNDASAVRQKFDDLSRFRTFSSWHEDDGPVLWWRLPVEEPPWVGTPLDSEWPYGDYTFGADDGPRLAWTPLPKVARDLGEAVR